MKPDFLNEYDFFAGVPDSLLRPFCDYLMSEYGISRRHIIAANEGNAAALAAGYHLATGKVPVVYLQNSGIGNLINPAASLLSDDVYGIPCIFVIGWRGEPGVHDEPQHLFQGKTTLKLLADMDVSAFVIGPDTTEEELKHKMEEFRPLLAAGRSVAFVVRKGSLEAGCTAEYKNPNVMLREEVIRRIAEAAKDGVIVATTGKTSRELFEIRNARHETHSHDFLTVGSMGHSSSIALGIALAKPGRRVWCLDGDGAVLMHMGAMALIGANSPGNMVHVVLNNCAHESVGGMPTAAGKTDLMKIAEGCGYPRRVSAENFEELESALSVLKEADELCFLEVKTAIGSRPDLGRPTTSPRENKENFMRFLGTDI